VAALAHSNTSRDVLSELLVQRIQLVGVPKLGVLQSLESPQPCHTERAASPILPSGRRARCPGTSIADHNGHYPDASIDLTGSSLTAGLFTSTKR
jgi:hypothetical protein